MAVQDWVTHSVSIPSRWEGTEFTQVLWWIDENEVSQCLAWLLLPPCLPSVNFAFSYMWRNVLSTCFLETYSKRKSGNRKIKTIKKGIPHWKHKHSAIVHLVWFFLLLLFDVDLFRQARISWIWSILSEQVNFEILF